MVIIIGEKSFRFGFGSWKPNVFLSGVYSCLLLEGVEGPKNKKTNTASKICWWWFLPLQDRRVSQSDSKSLGLTFWKFSDDSPCFTPPQKKRTFIAVTLLKKLDLAIKKWCGLFVSSKSCSSLSKTTIYILSVDVVIPPPKQKQQAGRCYWYIKSLKLDSGELSGITRATFGVASCPQKHLENHWFLEGNEQEFFKVRKKNKVHAKSISQVCIM